ncbi:MAG: NAD-binding protein [Halioglobus sp.]|nr:NAD-binding protein [Halioglobus sp.]
MGHVFYLLLRRLRAPFLTIIVIYAISTLGFVLIPGVDDEGNPWRMDFFHAFYFVSFMGSTIGFGEIPYPFTAAQRAWTMLMIYATVIGWLYSIGKILSLFQDPGFNRLMRRTTFARRVRRIADPFYLVCGFGYTGKRLVSKLDLHGIQTVVIDSNPLAIDELEAHSLGLAVPGLCADSADPDALNIAGIRRKNCAGVIALTNDDHTNLAVSIDSKLVDPQRLVISRSQSASNTANLASFGTDYIIDPFETFAQHLVKSIREPYKHIISDLVFNPYHKVWASPHQDTSGRWIVCGYGRFGRAIDRLFHRYEIPITFIEADPALRGAPAGTVLGMGTEEDTLREAKIETATGIVAGTPDDADNLSIILTARQVKPDLITVARQNLSSNKPMFRAAAVNLIMEPVRIIADEIFIRIKTPLLMEFLEGLQAKDELWARELVVRIGRVVEDQPMESWAYNVNADTCPAIVDSLDRGKLVTLGHMCRNPRNRDDELPALPLLLKRGSKRTLLPAPDTAIEAGDDILVCGKHSAVASMTWIIVNYNVLRYIRTGIEAPGGLLWQWLSAKRKTRSRN